MEWGAILNRQLSCEVTLWTAKTIAETLLLALIAVTAGALVPDCLRSYQTSASLSKYGTAMRRICSGDTAYPAEPLPTCEDRREISPRRDRSERGKFSPRSE